jgi:hypothetical protein
MVAGNVPEEAGVLLSQPVVALVYAIMLVQPEEPVLRLRFSVLEGGELPVLVEKSIATGVLVSVGTGETIYVTFMVFGLPATSPLLQMFVEQPLTVIVPVNVPAFTGASGVIVIVPVVDPVI